MPTRQVIIADSSKISTFEECNCKCNYSYNEHITSFGDEKEAIAAGTYGHKLLEIYYKALFQGHKAYAASNRALEFDMDRADKQEDKFPLSTENRELVRARFSKYWMLYQERDFIPLFQPNNIITFSNSGMLVDKLVDDPLVEKGFSYKLLDTSEYLFVLEGRIDMIDYSNSVKKFVDHKFQFRQRDLYSKSIQFRNYALASGCNIGIINYIRLHKNETDKTFVRQPISFNPSEIRLWREELIDIFIRMAQAEKQGYPRNRDACPGKFGYPCEFVPICDEGNPHVREAIKNTNFKKKVEWKPW